LQDYGFILYTDKQYTDSNVSTLKIVEFPSHEAPLTLGKCLMTIQLASDKNLKYFFSSDLSKLLMIYYTPTDYGKLNFTSLQIFELPDMTLTRTF
jgi:hypothetical protein